MQFNSFIRSLTLILLLAFVLPACQKFLDVKPESDLTTGNAYNSAKDIENAMVGAYRAFYYEYYIWDNVLLSDVRSDNAYSGGGDDQPIDQYDWIAIPSSNNRMYANWSQLYVGIARCNLILNKIGDVTDPELDVNNLRQQLIGEASFLRAFHYFQLVKTYGGVPIELNSNSADESKTNLPRATEQEVYNQIVSDLEVAVRNLPDSYGALNVSTVRATRGAANALLAKVWAQRSDRDYAKVILYCNGVLNSPAGYSLAPDYATLFDGDNYSNTESILEVPFIAGNWDVSNWGPQLYLAPEDGWQKYCVPSKDLIAAYNNEGDNVRLNANVVFWNNVPWADENWNPCQIDSEFVPFNYKQKHPNGWNGGDHQYLLRLADILLLKAEAQNETGDLAGANATLKLVRDRVGLPVFNGTSKAEMKAKILNERRLELAFEAQRWDDLVRNGVIVETMNNLKEYKFTCSGTTPSGPIPIVYNMNVNKILCPIPQRERDANPKLTQNPGY